ncbi:sensor histidine kinase [Sediminitomix flava]|uniref:histidine kinase n=1 Tax=Sediminitomix flava TaxID=379075 RepID=A0A315Z908_SEDFL|nr:PAS domain-containing sensor histidine kinase [Sediminitomix flava]PWJ42056.1 PAS domain S-box-containing protein [Sediminitomix flava]
MRNKTLDQLRKAEDMIDGLNVVDILTGENNLFKNIPNAFLIFEIENNEVIYSNEQAHQILNTDIPSEISTFLNTHLLPETSTEKQFFFELLQKKKSENVNINLIINGEKTPTNIQLFEIGSGLNLVGVMFHTQHTNSTEKQLQKGLELSHENWMLLDSYGKILRYNENFERISTQIFSENIYFGLDLRENTKWRNSILKAIHGQKVIEVITLQIDNQTRSFEVVISPLITSNEVYIEGILLFIKEVTNSLKVEELLKNSFDEIRNFKVALNRTSLVCVTDPRGYINEVNDLFCSEAKYSYDELIGENINKVLPSLQLPNIYKELSSKTNENSFWREEVQSTDKAGNTFWLDLMFSPVSNKKGEIYQILCIGYPITERKKGEIERQQLMTDLIQHNRNLEQFAFTISHKLRAPLARVIGLAELLKIDDYQTSHKSFVDKLLSSTKELDLLLKGLIEILSFRQNSNLEKKTLDLNYIIQTITSSLSTAINENNAVIEVDLAEDARSLRSIKSYIESIVYHLITNALKFRKKYLSPVIHIRSSKVENGILLEIKDNGVGIDLKNNKEKIFSMYQKLHSSHEGKGLGLYLVKSQVDELNGNIQVESAVNQGTIFKIFIPTE